MNVQHRSTVVLSDIAHSGVAQNAQENEEDVRGRPVTLDNHPGCGLYVMSCMKVAPFGALARLSVDPTPSIAIEEGRSDVVLGKRVEIEVTRNCPSEKYA